MPAKLKRALPWVLSIVIVAWLFSTADLDALQAAVLEADLAALLLGVVGFTFVTFLVDGATLVLLFRRLLTPMPALEVLAVKGVSYFLNAINYTAGAAAVAYFAYKKTPGLRFLRSLSVMVWLNFVDVAALLALAAVGMAFGHGLLPEDLAPQLALVVAVGWAIVVGALVYWRLGIDFLVLGSFRSWRLFQAFRDARMADYLAMVPVRIGYVGVWVLAQWVMLPTFGIHIDLATLLVYVPLLTFVQIVPASVSGLGAVQAVMIAMYAPHVDAPYAEAAARLLGFSTVVGPATALVRIAIGYAFMRNVTKDLVPSEADLAAARASDEASDQADP